MEAGAGRRLGTSLAEPLRGAPAISSNRCSGDDGPIRVGSSLFCCAGDFEALALAACPLAWPCLIFHARRRAGLHAQGFARGFVAICWVAPLLAPLMIVAAHKLPVFGQD